MVFPSARVYDGTAAGELKNYREVLQVLERLHIPFVDYYGQTKDFHMDDLYFGSEGHWRPAGHQEAAKLLRPLLVRLGVQSTTTQGDRP